MSAGHRPGRKDPALTRALVLGGGGITGIAWEIGMLLGLREAGVDLTVADTVVGTSAGSVVGAQLAGGVPLREMYDEQLADPVGEIAASMTRSMQVTWVATMLLPGRGETRRRRLGRAAVKASRRPGAVSVQERLEVFSTRLSVAQWSERDLRITAVDADTGEFVVFGRDSRVDLVHAVASSCAVPLVWPPVPVNGRRYVDGGVRSAANADVAEGADRVVVLAPLPQSFSRYHRIDAQLARTGARASAAVAPDAAALAAIGRNMLDPANRAAAAHAGYAQAPSVAAEVSRAWGTS
jgi:NTE family protein